MMRWISAVVVLACGIGVASANDDALIAAALADATRTFNAALPGLGGETLGVSTQSYSDALTRYGFTSAYWGKPLLVELVKRGEAGGNCGRFAAFVSPAPAEGVVRLVLCPQFFTEGADALRELTMLHEMVHVVAGPDECLAMAYAARVQMLAHGRFTPVDAYWAASGCAGSAYNLP